jgi:hypothetical protein
MSLTTNSELFAPEMLMVLTERESDEELRMVKTCWLVELETPEAGNSLRGYELAP